MAWLLGYISADGCIRPDRYEIKIKSIDYEMLSHAQKILNTNYSIKPEKNSRCFVLSFYGKRLVEDIQKYGITARKSLTLKMPEIPDDYFWDFLRGVVDGDGHIIPPHSQDSGEVRFQITSSKQFLEKLLKILGIKIDCPKYKLSPRGKAFELKINSSYAYQCLFFMYYNEKYGLSRKKNIALRLISNFEKSTYAKDRRRTIINKCRQAIIN